MSEQVRPPIEIEMKCCCGAQFFVTLPYEWVSNASKVIELAACWTQAHKAHHTEPAAKGTK